MTLPAETLRDSLDYCPESGRFSWKVGRGRARRGDLAGCVAKNNRGYAWVQIRLLGKLYSAHRLAWLHFYGEMPRGEIDHVNGDATDNRIQNLREVTHAENSRNQPMKSSNASGVTGVYWEQRTRKWRGEVKVDGQKFRVGRFANIDDAASAVTRFRADKGFSPRHGAEKLYRSA